MKVMIAILLISVALVLDGWSISLADDQPSVIRVHFTDLPNDIGRVGCTIFKAPGDGFPQSRDKATARINGPIQDKTGLCEFKGLTAGTYAVAVFHDQKETGNMVKNFLGMPTEAYGFSNDAKPSIATMSAPSFQACSFSYPGGTMDITIHAQH